MTSVTCRIQLGQINTFTPKSGDAGVVSTVGVVVVIVVVVVVCLRCIGLLLLLSPVCLGGVRGKERSFAKETEESEE